jgi:hypothetical protein
MVKMFLRYCRQKQRALQAAIEEAEQLFEQVRLGLIEDPFAEDVEAAKGSVASESESEEELEVVVPKKANVSLSSHSVSTASCLQSWVPHSPRESPRPSSKAMRRTTFLPRSRLPFVI